MSIIITMKYTLQQPINIIKQTINVELIVKLYHHKMNKKYFTFSINSYQNSMPLDSWMQAPAYKHNSLYSSLLELDKTSYNNLHQNLKNMQLRSLSDRKLDTYLEQLNMSLYDCFLFYIQQEKLEDTQGIIRSRKAQDRQHNGHKEPK